MGIGSHLNWTSDRVKAIFKSNESGDVTVERKTFQVPNIGCDGCVRSITNELNSIPGVVKVDGTVSTKVVTVEWQEPATWQQIVKTLEEIDYAPAEA
jgi:copper chaperone CopZ